MRKLRSDMTIDEVLNRHAEWHGRPSTEQEKKELIKSMMDDLRPPLKREVLTSHLYPVKKKERDWILILLVLMTVVTGYQIVFEFIGMYF